MIKNIKIAILFLSVICLLSVCTQKSKTAFLQKKEIQLTKPRVTANTVFIDSFVSINVDLKVDKVSIHYTSDGKEPDASSAKYKAPIQVSEPGTYKFKAFHPDWKPSNSNEITIYKKSLKADTIVWHSRASKKYSGQGNRTLNNFIMAPANFSDTQWAGFDTIASATVKLKKRTYVTSLIISYLRDVDSWIFPPKEISVYLDNDPASKREKIIVPLAERKEKNMETLRIPIEAEVNSLKIEVANVDAIPEWHGGRGKKAWLFMDEWIFDY